MEFNAGTVLNLFPGQVDIDMQGAPCRIPQSEGRDQYLAPGEDDACSNDNVADGPVLVIKIEILTDPISVSMAPRVYPLRSFVLRRRITLFVVSRIFTTY